MIVRGATKFREVTERNNSHRGSRSATTRPGARSSPHPGEPRPGARRAGLGASEGDGHTDRGDCPPISSRQFTFSTFAGPEAPTHSELFGNQPEMTVIGSMASSWRRELTTKRCPSEVTS